MQTTRTARFDARLTSEQKEMFEYASRLSGFKSLSEFVIYTVQEKARKIIDKRSEFLTSKEDRELFFETLFNPPAPNAKLKKALENYKNTLG